MRSMMPYSPTRSFNPFLFEDLDRFFDGWNTGDVAGSDYEFVEEGDHYVMSVDLPGIRKEDLKIEVRDGILTVSGERRLRSRKDQRKAVLTRSFELGRTIDADRIGAHYEDGVLHLCLPKTEAAKGRKIEIQAGRSGWFDRLLGSRKKENGAANGNDKKEMKDVTNSKVS